jgi:hypothetical protein
MIEDRAHPIESTNSLERAIIAEGTIHEIVSHYSRERQSIRASLGA